MIETSLSIPISGGAVQLPGTRLSEEDTALAESFTHSERLLRSAWIVMGSIVAILFGWGSLAPLNRGVIGPGRISTESARQVLQSPDGGPIQKVLVREGQHVRRNQPLVVLDPSQVGTEYEIVRQTYLQLLGERAMLQAFLSGGPIVWPAEFRSAAADNAVRRVMATQQRVLDDRRALRRAQQAVIDRQVAGLSERIGGLGSMSTSLDEQKHSIDDELAGITELYKKGYARKSQVEALRRARAELNGSNGVNFSQIGQARQSIGEARMNLAQNLTSAREDASARLAVLEGELLATANKLAHAKIELARTEIRSPVDGVVLSIHNKTIGAIVAAGEAVLEVVPDGAIEVVGQFRPNDVDSVYAGQNASIRLPGLNMQSTPVLHGKVTFVSADAITDKNGISYYDVRVTLPSDAKTELGGQPLTPGMPAEVMLDGGSRTALQYLLEPVTNAFSHAFRE